MFSDDQSFATRFFERRPDLRQKVRNSPEFQMWRDQFPHVIVDNIEYFVMGGDMLKDEDELMLEWVRREDIVTDDNL